MSRPTGFHTLNVATMVALQSVAAMTVYELCSPVRGHRPGSAWNTRPTTLERWAIDESEEDRYIVSDRRLAVINAVKQVNALSELQVSPHFSDDETVWFEVRFKA